MLTGLLPGLSVQQQQQRQVSSSSSSFAYDSENENDDDSAGESQKPQQQQLEKPDKREQSFLAQGQRETNEARIVLPPQRIALSKSLFNYSVYEFFKARTQPHYWLIGHPACRILQEKTVWINQRFIQQQEEQLQLQKSQHNNNNNNNKTKTKREMRLLQQQLQPPLFKKTLKVETPIFMPSDIPFAYRGTVRSFQVLECNAQGKPLPIKNEYEFIPLPLSKYRTRGSLAVSSNGIATLAYAIHPPPKDGGDRVYQAMHPLFRASNGCMFIDGKSSFKFKRPFSRQTRMIRICFLTYVLRDRITNELVGGDMPKNACFVSRCATKEGVDPILGYDMDLDAEVVAEYWLMYVRVLPFVDLSLDCHGYEIEFPQFGKKENVAAQQRLQGLGMRLHVSTNGVKLPDDPGLYVWEAGNVMHLTRHDLLLVDDRFDEEDGNVSLAVHVRPTQQYDIVKRFHPFRMLLIFEDPNVELPDWTVMKIRQRWSDWAPLYMHFYPQYYDKQKMKRV